MDTEDALDVIPEDMIKTEESFTDVGTGVSMSQLTEQCLQSTVSNFGVDTSSLKYDDIPLEEKDPCLVSQPLSDTDLNESCTSMAPQLGLSKEQSDHEIHGHALNHFVKIEKKNIPVKNLRKKKKVTKRCRKKGTPTKPSQASSIECPVCGKTQTRKSSLRIHMRTHTKEKPYECDICHRRFSVSSSLSKHKRLQICHDLLQAGELVQSECQKSDVISESVYAFKSYLYKCRECGREFKKGCSFASHYKSHKTVAEQLSANQAFICSVCNKQFQRASTLNRHMKNHQPEKPHKCDYCAKSFLCPSDLRRHSENVHGKIDERVARPYICECCKESFVQKSRLDRHMVRVHKMLSRMPYMCAVCGIGLQDKHLLIAHMSKHTGDKPLKCDKSFECDICHKSFAFASSIPRHKKECHSNERPYICDKCGSTHKSMKALKHHMKTHMSERPYQCDSCLKTFKTKEYLRRHEIRHDKGNAKFQCTMCDKTFFRSTELAYHQKKIHFLPGDDEQWRQFACESCGKQFRTRGDLNRHSVVHTGKKPYGCDICDKRFTQLGSLKDHLRIHNGEKPFKCKFCEKRFTQSSSLRTHKKHCKHSGL